MYEYVPAELKSLRQWVCWRGELNAKGRLDKKPINAMTGSFASSTNPQTWCDFDTAVRVAAHFDGIGFMFAPPYFGVDVDHVEDAITQYKDGKTDNIVAEFVYTLQSYAEYSVSGKGIHILCRGTLPPEGRKRGDVEMYQSGRFFTVTGNVAAEYREIVECTEQIKPLHEKYIGAGQAPRSRTPTVSVSLSEQEILEAARRSKQGETFNNLFNGDWETYYNTHSEADMAFANMLAFWCACDMEKMDHIFRSSRLMRDKWDRRQSGSTYGALTLTKAVKNCTKVYTPPTPYQITFKQAEPPPPPILYPFDDVGNGKRMVSAFGDQIRFNHTATRESVGWMYYDGRVWVFDQRGQIECLADQVIEQMEHSLPDYLRQIDDEAKIKDQERKFWKNIKHVRSRSGKMNMIAEARHHVAIERKDMDTYPHLLNTPSGILNLKTGQLMPHDPKLFLTKMTVCEYTDTIDCPTWLQFLNEIFAGDTELIHYIQKAVGYSLTGSINEHCAFFCYGTGRNGKSTFINILADILGDYVLNIQPETIMLKHNVSSNANSDIARLKGARFVTSAEPNEGLRLNEGLVKQLTGGDRVTARFLFESDFEFKPEFKLWMSTNHKPVIRGTDTGIWSRIRLIPFTVRIPDEKIDKRLPYRLRREMSGILHWAVEGCLLWQKEGLKMPKAVKDATKEYRSEMDVVAAWLDECCVVGDGRETSKDLFASYVQWAEENNEFQMSSRRFGQELSKRFERTRSNGNYYYNRLTIINEARPYQIHIGK